MRLTRSAVGVCLLGYVLVSGAVPAAAAAADTSTVEAAVKKVFVEDMAREKKRVDPLVRSRALYWPEAVITGDGATQAYRGPEGIAPLMGYGPDSGGACTQEYKVPVVTSGNLAVALVRETCTPPKGKPETYACLYVLEVRGGEWKVIREEFSKAGI